MVLCASPGKYTHRMLGPRPFPLDEGLPAHYRGLSGFKKLCQLLGVPTSKA